MIQNDPALRNPKMSRLLRIIIFIIIVLLLIFFGFRCSQTAPSSSKTTANSIEKNQPTKEEATLLVDETTKSNDKKATSDNSTEEKANNSQPATTEQTKPYNEKNNHADTPANHETQEPKSIKEEKKEKENTDKTTKTNTTAITAGSSMILKGVSFASGSDKLINSSITILNEVAKTLKEKSALHIEVAGYTDNQGNATTNTKLSQLRANQVKAHLITQGIKTDRINTKGYGANSPIASNNTEIGREQNRRVEIHVE
jgi:outer membrane protein OmpA-like peptidoglycan-associated protein